VRHGAGFNPLGPADDEGLARLSAALVAAGRDPGERRGPPARRGR
jgi:hypothetical protein